MSVFRQDIYRSNVASLPKVNNMETIYVKITSVYGNQTIYPVCDKAKLFASIAGTKTLTMSTIRTISKLGYIIETKRDEAVFS